MDKLDRCYIWHIITRAKLRLRVRRLRRWLQKEN